jgi:rhamnogalacturonyl hydrolase YesR
MKLSFKYITIVSIAIITFHSASSQQKTGNDVNTPLHALKPDYPVPYEPMSREGIKKVLDKVFDYLDAVTPAKIVNKQTNQEVSDVNAIDTNSIPAQGDYRLTSYEWGVTYSAMLLAGETTGDKRYTDYVQKRFEFLSKWIPEVKKLAASGAYKTRNYPFRQPIEPRALDDAGAICAAMIKAQRGGVNKNLRPLIDNYIDFVANKEYRLKDGTLARNRPQKNTLWLDDLYMGVPALAQMGKLTGNKKYYDDAVKQVRLFAQRMFNKDKGVYMHGWVESMDQHPEFRWARANGWALMAKVELLDVLPLDHPGRQFVLEQFRAHVKGLVGYQGGKGLWHQLLDRTDSYLETSATAIYAYCIARGCNKGWIDAVAFAPAAMLAWNAVTTKINDKGQVEGTCVGTGMAFDPAFYYYRPVNVFAAHSYGPVILAGAELYRMLEKNTFRINDSALQFYE